MPEPKNIKAVEYKGGLKHRFDHAHQSDYNVIIVDDYDRLENIKK